MKIQSLSIVVPSSCYNKCKFCVAYMTKNDYTNQIEKNYRFTQLYKNDYKKRLMFARDNGCNTMMITGNGEPLTNRKFLANLGEWNDNLTNPFYWIELQTSGTGLDDEYLRFLRNTVKVNTISLSLSSLLSTKNAKYNQTALDYYVQIPYICKEIKKYDFNLRISLNMLEDFDDMRIEDIFLNAKKLNADQLTFRLMYSSGNNTVQDKFVEEHSASVETINRIGQYIRDNGTALNILPHGMIKYSIHGMSVVLDRDCMSKEVSEDFKYLVLQPDCKLYSAWDDKASLIF